MKWLNLIKFFAPIILSQVNPHLGQVSDQIVQGITEAEGMKNASSDEKLAHAVNITNDAVKAINETTKIQHIDPIVVNYAAEHAISTIVDVVNMIHNSPANLSTK